MYCVDCGKEKDIFREGSCVDCYLKTHTFTKGPTIFDIPYCVHCEAYKYKNLWYNETFEDIVIRYLKQHVTVHPDFKHISFSLSCNDEKIKTCHIEIKGFIDDHEITESHMITIRIKNTVCDICSKQFGGYHEAILQIRPGKKKFSEKHLAQIEQFIEEQIIILQQKNTSLFLTDIGETHGGIDYLLSDKQAAFTLLKKTHEQFGGHITTSTKNVGMKDGKQLYRDTYLLRFPPFEPGDVLKIDHAYMFVEKLAKNTVHLYKLDTCQRSIHDVSDIEKSAVIGNDELQKKMIIISQNKDEIQIMDPVTYKMKTIKKPLELTITSEMVVIIYVDEEHLYLHPLLNQK